MRDVFRGKKDVKIDAKGRMSFPASFRRALEANHPDREEGENATMFIAHSDNQAFLTAYTFAGMEVLSARIDEMQPGSIERQALEEYLFVNIEEVTLDDNGRFVLPKRLRDLVGLTDMAVFAGYRDSFRIYSPEAPSAAVSVLSQLMANQPVNTSPLTLLPHTGPTQ
ncbi:division/cell wall cluster transcriptional repressor MraZ [Jannaschia sp. 2305UL9-9]|uniref:division/cell wall cluster transcriptional repressor MraZ n=1 Tax=Jannaschia sp. 2305UL9-9 TaxID=3121638 RepID=UPI003527238D